jgi:hypothetical protein
VVFEEVVMSQMKELGYRFDTWSGEIRFKNFIILFNSTVINDVVEVLSDHNNIVYKSFEFLLGFEVIEESVNR